MLGFEGSEEQESSTDSIDPDTQARMAADLRQRLDGPPPSWLAPDLPDVPPAPTFEPRQPIPWRSTTVAVVAQVPATLEAAFLNVPFTLLAAQVIIVAVMGLCLVLAEWMSINRVGLAPEMPQPNLERPHPHRQL